MSNPPDLTTMLHKLIATPSISCVQEELDMSNHNMINLLATWLSDLGFKVDILSLSSNKKKENLVARLGSGKDGLVLSGHTDTVPIDKHNWQVDPFILTEKDSRFYGLGIADMKGFFALAIEVAKSFSTQKLKKPLTIVATADEESTMLGARGLLASNVALGRYCVIGEPTNLIPVRQHKGVLMEGIRLHGRSGHSSDPSLGNSALEGMAQVIQGLTELREEMAQTHYNDEFAVPTPTLNFGRICGGDNPNRICAECELYIDCRPLPNMDIDKVRADIRTRVQQIADKRKLQCTFSALFYGVPAMQTPNTSEIVKVCEQLTKKQSTAVAFGTEGPFMNQLGMETVILGPGNIAQAHQPNEYLEMKQIKPTLDILEQLISRFCLH